MENLFWNFYRVRRMSFAIIFALLVAVPIGYFFYPEQTNSLRKGDFPAFYSAAVIVHQGLGHQLYDPKLQSQIQNQYWPDTGNSVMYFAYPPYVAALISPLAFFSPQIAKWLMTLIMIFFLAAALRMVALFSTQVRQNWVASTACLLGCAPIYVGLLCGQNTALSIFSYAGLMWSLTSSKNHENLSGLFLGLWLFKPHFALILFMFLILAKQWKVLKGFFVVAAIFYLLGALAASFHWPVLWLKAVSWFVEKDFEFNQNRMISIVAFFKTLSFLLQSQGLKVVTLNLLGAVSAISLFAGIGFLFWKVGRIKNSEIQKEKLRGLISLAGPALLLISPHSLFYDFGLCWISCVGYFQLKTDRSIHQLIGFLIVISVATGLRESVVIQPLLGLTALIFLGLLARLR